MLIIPRDFGPKKGKIFDEDLDDSEEGWKEEEEGDEDENDLGDMEEDDDSYNEGDWEETDEDIDFDE